MTDYQQLLFPYAYNILGTAEDARDAVQEVLSRYFTTAHDDVTDEKNYLIRSVINLAINHKNRNKRMTPQPAEWLPEPVATDDNADRNVYLKDILSYSLMVLMERLSPIERAVFILKESFDYSHQEIADVLSISEEYSRKLLSRAKTRLFKPGAEVKSKEVMDNTNRLVSDYVSAIRQRDLSRLEEMLSAEVTLITDGGGKVKVVAKVSNGFEEVSNVLRIVIERYLGKAEIRIRWINHQPALLFLIKNRLVTCQVLEFSADGTRIVQVNNVVDPAKLKLLASSETNQ
ncbi:sigma-70 family RNA polymerase sigma factor [Chitinophaga sp. CB10]|uniref:sigma-70 family RNA polymerase sigma factor n=1 Tax=Chitinophaga sp. CB10 TaxID=1891659 RepID=UPI0025BB01B2|nr:sigma-70 family RNA polymerase sigma factor [Chitinophaga sp. CB10]